MKRFIIIVSGLLMITVSSCTKDKPSIGGTATEKVANQWWVQLYDASGALVYAPSYHAHLATYNASANNNEFWIDDQGEIWDFKVKAKADLSILSFSANKAVSVIPNYNIWVNITEGKVIENGGRSRSGVVTDSIFMKVQFEDDPANTYTIRGHARTRFLEDEY